MEPKTTKEELINAEIADPGVAVDVADNERESAAAVDAATRCLNNNHAGDSDYQNS